MIFKKSIVNVGNVPCTVVKFNYKQAKSENVFEKRLHFIQILDRSGSMTAHIEELVENVKKTIDVMDDRDLLTVIWFSGPGQYRVLLKGASPKDEGLKGQLDKLKSTIGTTCFSEAVAEAKEVVEELSELCDNFVLSLFTDGEPVVPWSTKEEEERTKSIVSGFSEKILSFNTIGYGGYYNINFLKELASLSKFGRHAHSTKINEYLPIFMHNFKAVENMSSDKIEIKCDGREILCFSNRATKLDKDYLKVNIAAKGQNCFYIISQGTEDFKFIVNDESYTSSNIKGELSPRQLQSLLYTLSFEEYYKGNSDRAVDILVSSLKDRYLSKTILNSFTAKERQKCTDTLCTAAHNRKLKLSGRTWAESRLKEGILQEGELSGDGPCFMQLLEMFENNKDKFIPVSRDKYKRIGRKVVDNYNAFKVDNSVKLTAEFTDLVFSKEKLNISIRYELHGDVVINPRQARAVGFNDNVFKAKIYREQTIIKDGDINIDKFEALVSKSTLEYLNGLEVKGLFSILENNKYELTAYTLIELDISKIPVLNRGYVSRGDSLDYILDNVFEQRVAECRQKVLKYYLEKTDKAPIYKDQYYTKEQVDLLKTYGLDSNGVYQGIDNKVISEGTDQYECKFFEFSLKGFSTLPKVEDVISKMKAVNKKLNKPETIMEDYIKYINEEKLTCNAVKLSKLLESQKFTIRKATRVLAQIKLAKALTGSWWSGLKLDSKDNYLYERGDKTLVVKVVRKVVKI